MDKKTFLDNFGVIADAPNGIQQLRELVIALSVSGELSDAQDRDEPVLDLLNRISVDFQPHPVMSEIRFAIPPHWKWIPLASIAEHQLGKMLNTSKMKGVRRKYLRSVNVLKSGIIDLSDVKEMLIPEIELDKYNVRVGDLFVNEGGDVGRNAIWLSGTDEEFAFQNQLHRLRPLGGISSRYLQLILRNAKSSGVIAEMSSGVTIQHFSATAIRKLACPLPPVEEQQRIVVKVDELMALCDELEAEKTKRETLRTAGRASAIDAISTATTPEELAAAWSRISNNWDAIADSPSGVVEIRRLILDLAVMGKLVEQRVSDLPILEQDELESPFEIPDSWRWKALPNVTSDLGQQTPNEPFSYIDVSSIDKERGVISADLAVIQASNAPSRARKRVALGTVIYSTVRPYLRNIAIVDRVIEPPAIASTAFAILNPCEHLDSQFLYLCVRSSYFTTFVESKQKGVAYPAINAGDLAKAPIPLPPLSEQKRIVAKVDELMQICDELEVHLIASSEIESAFAGASSQLLIV